MTTVLILLAIAAAIFLLTRSKRKAPSKPGWRMEHSPGAKPLTLTPGGWHFDFPTEPTSHVHYVQWFDPPALSPDRAITIRFRVTGGGFVPQEFPDRTATVSLLLQRKGDNWAADARTRSYRWFSSDVEELAPGDYLMIVPLDVSAWSDVYNGQDAEAFQATLQNLDNIGLVFGSAGGRGHGVYATQPSRFTLLDISL